MRATALHFLFASILACITEHVGAFAPPLPFGKGSGTVVAIEKAQSTQQTYQSAKSIALKASEVTEPSTNFDTGAVLKYGTAVGVQMGLISTVLLGLDKIVEATGITAPFAVNFIIFYFLALKSRVFNPLSNTRPKQSSLEVNEEKRKMPSWTPPGPVFPIVWLLLIGPLRAATSAMVYSTIGSYFCPAILSLALHLSIGDVWNTINNVERRYGVSVVGVLCVWLSKAFAAYSYFGVNETAGKLLGLSLVWLTIASSLVTRTWQLNPDSETGKPEPLYPVTGKTKTTFTWFSSDESSA